MNTVERIRYIATVRGIPISKLERDLGFGNGYFAALKRGDIPAARLSLVAEYFAVSPQYLMNEPDEYGLTFDDWYTIGTHFGVLVRERNLEKKASIKAGVPEEKLKWFFDGVSNVEIGVVHDIESVIGVKAEVELPEYADKLRIKKEDVVSILQKLRDEDRALLDVAKGMTPEQVKLMTEFAKSLKGDK